MSITRLLLLSGLLKPLLSLVALLLSACAMVPKGSQPLDTQVWARSHNGSDVDVYLCAATGMRNGSASFRRKELRHTPYRRRNAAAQRA
jgi:hypothetical protein